MERRARSWTAELQAWAQGTGSSGTGPSLWPQLGVGACGHDGSSFRREVHLLDEWSLFSGQALGGSVAESSTKGAFSGGAEPGLENAAGANHCFLNVVIQALWNLQSFRERLLRAPEHHHGAIGAEASETEGGMESCCLALKALFQQFQLSEGGGALPPDVLRRALSDVYTARGRFQWGEMEDATETIEALLAVLHAWNVRPLEDAGCLGGGLASGGSSSSSSNCAPAEARAPAEPPPEEGPSTGGSPMGRRLSEVERVEEASNFGCHPLCIAHEVFGVEYVDLRRCNFCGATEEPAVASAFLYPVYVADLLGGAGAQGGGPSATAPAAPGEGWRGADGLGCLVSGAAIAPRAAAAAGARGPALQDVLRGLCQREVPQKCPECNSLHTVSMERWLTRQPFTFMISLVWPSSTPSRETVWWVLALIEPELRLERIFRTARGQGSAPCGGPSVSMGHVPRSHAPAKEPPGPSMATEVGSGPAEAYAFRGLVCYCGMHYVALFWCWSRMKWILFDDTCVREEADWSGVAGFVTSDRYLPTLLFYERMDHGGPLPHEGSLAELARQLRSLEEHRSVCAAM